MILKHQQKSKKIKILNNIPPNKCCMEYISTDLGGYKITSSLLDKLLIQSKIVNKIPILCIRIKKNEKEWYILKCIVEEKNV